MSCCVILDLTDIGQKVQNHDPAYIAVFVLINRLVTEIVTEKTDVSFTWDWCRSSAAKKKRLKICGLLSFGAFMFCYCVCVCWETTDRPSSSVHAKIFCDKLFGGLCFGPYGSRVLRFKIAGQHLFHVGDVCMCIFLPVKKAVERKDDGETIQFFFLNFIACFIKLILPLWYSWPQKTADIAYFSHLSVPGYGCRCKSKHVGSGKKSCTAQPEVVAFKPW